MHFSRSLLLPVMILLFVFSHRAAADVNEFSDHLLAVKTFAETPGYGIKLESLSTGRIADWRPNTRVLTGVQVTIKDWIGLGIAGVGSLGERDRVMKGRTEYMDYRLSFGNESLRTVLNFGRYRGFYLENSSQIDPAMGSTQPYLQDESFSLRNISVNLTYVFHPKNFSLIAALDQTVRQEQSGGSALAGVTLCETRFANDEPLVPAAIRAEYGQDQMINMGRFRTATIQGGYGYTLVGAKKWFFSLSGLLGLGMQSAHFSGENLNGRRATTSGHLEVIASTGYNGDTFFSGLTASTESTVFTTASLKISSNLSAAKFFFGGRF